ncbi:hypothetical protein B0H12DRAFT_786998 [Mycena haematopus]|nr:hypothetical protein B0H12DRAFT_786998 [Mycena haematopus]
MLRHCGPHIEVLVQPEFPRMERLYAASLDIPLPLLLSLTRVYWIESTWSLPLLRAVLAVAPNLKHLTLSSSPSIGSGFSNAEPSEPPVFPPLYCLQSLVLLPFDSLCVHALLQGANWPGSHTLPSLQHTSNGRRFPSCTACAPLPWWTPWYGQMFHSPRS